METNQTSQGIAILRIKRRRDEEPLDALGLSARSSKQARSMFNDRGAQWSKLAIAAREQKVLESFSMQRRLKTRIGRMNCPRNRSRYGSSACDASQSLRGDLGEACSSGQRGSHRWRQTASGRSFSRSRFTLDEDEEAGKWNGQTVHHR
jgi:hypothetical protein